ncbi:MAG: DUF116 domain-containing protein [Methanomicrobiales archaeon]|nr:DUF116 domain-containing protein [Methanomicrobiales archaeon]
MFSDSPLWNQLMIITGEITLLAILAIFLIALVLVVITVFSIRRRRLYFPRLLPPGLVALEGLVKALCGLFGLDNKELMEFFITIHNTLNRKAFAEIPVRERAIFFPQCLRSAKCPASLSPEGIKCKRCGACPLGEWIERLEGMGYHTFIVPGSSFIKRMVKKYRPKAIVGVGCIMEVKEGLEMCDIMGMPAIGIVTLKDGCVETLVNWNDVCDVTGARTSGRNNLDVPAR